MPASDRPGPPKVPLLCAACVGSLTCRPCTQRAHTLVEERRAVLRQSRGRHSLHARLNTPPRLHQTPLLNPHANRETYSSHTSVHEWAGITAELLPSAVYLISYLNKAKHRPGIAHLRRSPISSFTILSTLTMAYEE